jgi:hypothetical protein
VVVARHPSGRRGWHAATPSGLGVAFQPPLGVAVAYPEAGGGHRVTPKRFGGGLLAIGGGSRPLIPFYLFLFFWGHPSLFFIFYFYISLFIYFLINLYFFIQMDTCCHLIGLMWRCRDI